MNDLSPYAYRRSERQSQAASETKFQIAVEKARMAVAEAMKNMPGSIRKMVDEVNLQLTELPNSQEVARCTIHAPEKVEAMSNILVNLKAIEQELEELTFLPINALSREAGE
jgi:hypothetical protein